MGLHEVVQTYNSEMSQGYQGRLFYANLQIQKTQYLVITKLKSTIPCFELSRQKAKIYNC